MWEKWRQNILCTHVGDNREHSHAIEDFLPCSNAVGLGGDGTSVLSGELPGVHSDLYDVVEESQEWSQRKGGHEERDESKLDHWDEKREKD